MSHPWRLHAATPSAQQVRELLSVIHGGHQRRNGQWYPNTRTLAARFRVAPRTAQRWTAGDPDSPTRMPQRRLRNLVRRHRPTRALLRRESAEAKQWQSKSSRKRLGRGRGNLDEYAHLGWLEPHRVGIYQHMSSPLRQ